MSLLHLFLPLIVHWSLAAILIGGAVAVYVFVPVQLAKQAAIVVAIGTGIYIFAYSAGDRDGAARVQFQFDAYIVAEKAVTEAEVARQRDVAAAALRALHDRLAAAAATADAADENVRRLEAALAAKPPIAGRGATQDDVDALNP